MKIKSGSGGRRRVHHLLLAAGATAGLMGLAGEARAQWTVINLHPAGASESTAAAVHGTTQVGTINNNLTAVLWRGGAETVVRLNTTPGGTGRGYAAFGDQQGGGVSPTSQAQYAALWSGTAESMVNLHPAHIPGVIASSIKAIDGAMQGGTWTPESDQAVHFGRACIWSGTPESWVDLHPAGYETSNILGISGNQQVGATYDTGLSQAAMWNGTAESFVNLNEGAFLSVATCTDGVHQYGALGILEPVPGIFPVRWSGTAASWENMGAPNDGWGGVSAVHGGWAVGSTTSAGGSDDRACVWAGGPGTHADLHQFLPAECTWSRANGIWRHEASGTTYVVGDALIVDGGNEHGEAVMWVTGPGVNLITAAPAPADCSATAGDPLTFTARVVNAGADAGTALLTVDLPPASEATFVSAVPAPTSATPTQLVFDLGSLAPTGGLAEVSITMTAVQPGATPTLAFSASAPGEVHAENNTSSASSRITPTPALTAAATAVFSTDPALDNSLVPGGDGARFTAFNQPVASPSGNWWTLRASTDLPDALRFVMLRTPTGGQPALLAQTGVTTTSNGTVVVFAQAKVNDAGVVALVGGDSGPEGTRHFLATTTGNGAPLTEVARAGQPIPALPGETYFDGPWAPISLLADGTAAFYTVTWPGMTDAFLTNNGADSLVRAGDWPAWSELPIESLRNYSGSPGGLALDATGSQHIFQATLATGSDADDEIVVANSAIIAQEGVTVLPGSESPVDILTAVTMGPAGDWMIRGRDTDGATWTALGQGQAITSIFNEGDPIHQGAAERWQAHPLAGSFFVQAVDAAGNFVIGGRTDTTDPFADAVLVYNDQAVIARENDPVDLDGNGLFDDGVYIRSIDHDSVTFIPGAVLFTISLRDENAALCHTNDESRGQAVVRVDLPGCPTDWNDDGAVNSGDISSFLTAWIASVQAPDLVADFNNDGATNSGDISSFLTAWINAVTNGC